jgi:hypothetical protein
MDRLRRAVTLHRPDLLPLVESVVNVRLLTPDEREAHRDAVSGELTIDGSGALDPYGLQMDGLITRLGEISQWD